MIKFNGHKMDFFFSYILKYIKKNFFKLFTIEVNDPLLFILWLINIL